MINCIIADEFMPTPSRCTHPPSLNWGYAFVAQSVHLETISLPSHSTIHFIGTIINDNTGNVLEYQHLMIMGKHKHVWAHGFANKLGQLFQGIRTIHSTDTCFFIPKLHVPAQKNPPTAAFAAIIDHKKKKNIALGVEKSRDNLIRRETDRWPRWSVQAGRHIRIFHGRTGGTQRGKE
jgi:hypothetical protein